jgi:hypothetical protein
MPQKNGHEYYYFKAIKLAQAGRESNDQDTNLCSHQGLRDCLFDLRAVFAAISLQLTLLRGIMVAIAAISTSLCLEIIKKR